MPSLMPYTPFEIAAYRQAFHRRIADGDPAAEWEYELWQSTVIDSGNGNLMN